MTSPPNSVFHSAGSGFESAIFRCRYGGDDSGEGLNWEDALAWVEQNNAEAYLGYSDWRLPDAKELQSIVDYTRSPDTTGSAAIDPVFDVTFNGLEGIIGNASRQ